LPPTNVEHNADRADRKECLLSRVVFVRLCLVILCGLFAVSVTGVCAQSLTDQVASLEERLGVQPPDTASVSDRLGNLEKTVFGDQKTGTLMERLEKLNASVSARSQPSQRNQPVQSNQAIQPIQPIEPVQPIQPTQPVQPIQQGQLNQSSNAQPAQTQYIKPANQGGYADPEIAKIVQMLPLANDSKVTFVRIEPPYTNLAQVGDYFPTVLEASKHRLLRFQHMPIPIYITPYQDKEFIRACNGAFEMWEQRSNGIVRFTQVDDPNKARIRVIWSRLGLGQSPNDCVLGAHTITKWSDASGSGLTSFVFAGIPVGLPHGPKYVVQPQVIEVNLDLIYARPDEVRLRLLRNVVAHELGHAVGLMGHSPQRSDLMNALTDECSRISRRDINTLQKLYESPVDIPL
jgi:hypothetical protein